MNVKYALAWDKIFSITYFMRAGSAAGSH